MGRKWGYLVGIVAGFAVIGAVVAVPAVAAKPGKGCSDKQVEVGKCGKLPERSCLPMLDAADFVGLDTAGLLNYRQPKVVQLSDKTVGGTVEKVCAVQLHVIQPAPYTPGAIQLNACKPHQQPDNPFAGPCEYDNVAFVFLNHEPNARGALEVTVKNFCNSSYGDYHYIHGVGRKACVNSSGTGNMALDNYFVQVRGFPSDETGVTATEELKRIVKKLLSH
jgi:hypothetical protein